VDRDSFTRSLDSEGYKEVVTVKREAYGNLCSHAHPFEAKALILTGELTLRVDGAERCYHVGEVFHLAANEPHEERYGPAGVSYLVGRR
jgi:quercetin dioxygenase-like cupin family protein